MNITQNALFLVIAVQVVGCLVMAASSLVGISLGERFIARWMRCVFGVAFVSSLVAGASMAWHGERVATLQVGTWALGADIDFQMVLQLDALSVPFMLLATALCGLVAAFSERYLHREPGYQRYFFLLCLFGLGYSLTVTAGSIEVLYASWELLGLSSAMLIGFFQERPGPVSNGLYAFIVYRVCDLGLVLASVFIYQHYHTGLFTAWLGAGGWPHAQSTLSLGSATLIGAFLLLAAAGKAAQIPFSGWLPRAMEGPTPSTAIFYGALSVHAGAYLMLRISPLLDASAPLSAAVFMVGIGTAVSARVVGRAQSDIKCSLAYASLGQVGLIFAEIGLGFRVVPVIHALGHATLRSVQFLKAPSLLHDIHEMHSAVGDYHLWKAAPIGARAYRFALERADLETLGERFVLRPFLRFCASLRGLDRRVLEWLLGPENRP